MFILPTVTDEGSLFSLTACAAKYELTM